MRFTVVIDSQLLEEATQIAQLKTKKAVIEKALKEFIWNQKLKELIQLEGSGIIDFDLDEFKEWRHTGVCDS